MVEIDGRAAPSALSRSRSAQSFLAPQRGCLCLSATIFVTIAASTARPNVIGLRDRSTRPATPFSLNRLFHTRRHSFGTHAALFGVNPWRLQAWLGHKRVDETMLHVHVAEAHPRELPEVVREKARGIDDPDQRVLAMLGARGSVEPTEVRGSGVAVATASSEGTAAIIAASVVRAGGSNPDVTSRDVPTSRDPAMTTRGCINGSSRCVCHDPA